MLSCGKKTNKQTALASYAGFSFTSVIRKPSPTPEFRLNAWKKVPFLHRSLDELMLRWWNFTLFLLGNQLFQNDTYVCKHTFWILRVHQFQIVYSFFPQRTLLYIYVRCDWKMQAECIYVIQRWCWSCKNIFWWKFESKALQGIILCSSAKVNKGEYNTWKG